MHVRDLRIHSGALPKCTIEMLLEDLCDAALDRELTRYDLAIKALQAQQLVNPHGYAWTSREAIAARCGLHVEQVAEIIERLRDRDYGRQGGFSNGEVVFQSPAAAEQITLEQLKQLALANSLRMRAFGEERSISAAFRGDLQAAADSLTGMFATGWVALYRDERGLFLGPPNPELIDHDPLAFDDEKAVIS